MNKEYDCNIKENSQIYLIHIYDELSSNGTIEDT